METSMHVSRDIATRVISKKKEVVTGILEKLHLQSKFYLNSIPPFLLRNCVSLSSSVLI